MKTLLTILAMAFAGQMFGQSLFNSYETWEHDTTIITEWVVNDTINYNPDGDNIWVYSEWILVGWGMSPDKVFEQYRISDRGIREKREKFINYKYIPPEISDYEKKMNEIEKLVGKSNAADVNKIKKELEELRRGVKGLEKMRGIEDKTIRIYEKKPVVEKQKAEKTEKTKRRTFMGLGHGAKNRIRYNGLVHPPLRHGIQRGQIQRI